MTILCSPGVNHSFCFLIAKQVTYIIKINHNTNENVNHSIELINNNQYFLKVISVGFENLLLLSDGAEYFEIY